MSLIACGINYKTAPVALREKAVFNADMVPQPLHALIAQAAPKEAAILSTCNRTEFYCVGSEPAKILRWLQQQKQIASQDLIPHFYIYHDEAAVQHLLRVASGLDSLVLGETQILGQLKAAYTFAERAGTLGKYLQRLFQYVFSVTKQVRTETTIGTHPVSIAATATNLAAHIFADLKQACVLLIGAGETIELTARHLQSAGVQQFIVANRTQERAVKIARKVAAETITLSDIGNHLARADIVISATASPIPVIGKGVIESALKTRKHRVMFMIDLAVPRDIEPQAAELNDVYLYSLDDLQNITQQNLASRQTAAAQAEKIIESHTERYMHSLKLLEAVPVICAYRDKAEQLRDIELEKVLQELQNNKLTSEQALQRLAYRLTNKLLHAPTQQLRQAAYRDDQELLRLAKQLFEII